MEDNILTEAIKSAPLEYWHRYFDSLKDVELSKIGNLSLTELTEIQHRVKLLEEIRSRITLLHQAKPKE